MDINEIKKFFKDFQDLINCNRDKLAENAGNYLDLLYSRALEGFPPISVPIDKLVEDYLKENKNPEIAINKLINNQVKKCTTTGLFLGIPGGTAIIATLPANISSVLYVQLRMVAAIAKMRGHDIYSDQVKTFIYMCLAGSSFADYLKNTSKVIVQNSAKEFIKKNISREVLTNINQKIGYRLLTKFGGKGVINIGRFIPVLGGIVGGSFDFVTTKIIAKRALKNFERNDDDNQ